MHIHNCAVCTEFIYFFTFIFPIVHLQYLQYFCIDIKDGELSEKLQQKYRGYKRFFDLTRVLLSL